MLPLRPLLTTWLPLLFACREEAGETGTSWERPELEDVQPTDTAREGNGATLELADDAAAAAYDCGQPLPPVGDVQHIEIATEEDFDFDLQGYLMFQEGSNLVGRSFDGGFALLAPGVTSDMAGIQTFSDGNVVVAAPYSGSLQIVNRVTGTSTLLIGGLSNPNGLELGPGDTVYFTEYSANRVRWIDPVSGTSGEISSVIDLPNGLAFTSDSQALYVTANGAGTEGIVKFARTETGFDEGTVFLAGGPGDFFDSVETDVCGNVYTAEYSSGNVYRISPDGLEREIIANLVDVGYEGYSSIKWGNDVESWNSTTLYITNRHKIFVIDIGIPGTPDVLPPF